MPLEIKAVTILLQCFRHVSQAITGFLPKPRQTLREGCRVTLTIQTPSVTQSQFLRALARDRLFQALKPCTRTDCTSRGLRAATTDKPRDEHEDDDAEDNDDLFYMAYQDPKDFPNNSHLWNPIDGLYLALANDDREVVMLRTHEDEPFTHLVKIVYAPGHNATVGQVEEIRGRGCTPHTLCLYCPTHAPGNEGVPQRQHTLLSPAQLLAARDFLSPLLPCLCAKTPEHVHSAPDAGSRDSGPVRVVVVAPTDRSVDVFSIFVFYLASMSEQNTTHMVSAYVDEVAGCNDIWLGLGRCSSWVVSVAWRRDTHKSEAFVDAYHSCGSNCTP